MVLLRFIATSYQHSRWSGRSTLIFSECYKQAIFERIHFTLSGIEDFASSRRRIDNLSVWPMFQLFTYFSKEPTFLERAPGGSHIGGSPSRGARIFQKTKNNNTTNEIILMETISEFMYYSTFQENILKVCTENGPI